MNPWGLLVVLLGVLLLALAVKDTGGTLLDGLGWTHGTYSTG